MSGHQSTAQQKAGRRTKCRARGGASQRGGNPVEVYLHFVKDMQAALLAGSGSASPIQDIQHKSGADVQLAPNPSPVQDTKTVIIRGSRLQIETAVRLINQETGVKESLSRQAQAFWLQWVEAAFPDLDSRAYFLPPVYVNRVPMTRQVAAGQEVLVLQSGPGQACQSIQQAIQPSIAVSAGAQASIAQPPCVQDNDIRDDAAMQRVFLCLQELFEQNKEVLFAMTQLQFGEYLGEPCYAAAAAQLPLPASLPPVLPRKWKQGDFDVLLIHRHFGLVVCEVKAFGDKVKQQMSQKDKESIIRKKMTLAMSQLDKAEAMLSHLVSDIASGLRITKTIALPNITADELQQAISGDLQLTQDLCQCLGTSDPADIPGLCLCSDKLSDPRTPYDVSSHVMKELRHWWQRSVAGAGPDTKMTFDGYKKLLIRFCGPATTVSVPCISPPRMCIKTQGQGVSFTGDCYTAFMTLFPEQVQLLNTATPRVCLVGPPGTGKTVVLLLKGMEWLRRGHHVHVESTCAQSRAACRMLYYLLLRAVSTQQLAGVSPNQLHFLQHDLFVPEGEKKAVDDLVKDAIKGSLYVLADEAQWVDHVHTFCDEMLRQVPHLHLWAASYLFQEMPDGWQVEYLTRPLRSPPAVVREVEQDASFVRDGAVNAYSDRGVADHTDGPPIKIVRHKGQGHSLAAITCVTCGREVANFLKELCNPGQQTTVPTPPCLQWRDMLVLHWDYDIRESMGLFRSLGEAGIPIRVLQKKDIEDLAEARSDVVWVADGESVRGLERKVIVCINIGVQLREGTEGKFDLNPVRLHLMSRCTSQLVIITDH